MEKVCVDFSHFLMTFAEHPERDVEFMDFLSHNFDRDYCQMMRFRLAITFHLFEFVNGNHIDFVFISRNALIKRLECAMKNS